MCKVIVLMSTYNGEKYLQEQIDSILAQTLKNISLLIRDDGSIDGTQKILEKYQQDAKVRWYQGESLGPAQSFLEILRQAGSADYYAFSDQDDYWKPEKLERAIIEIEKENKKVPTLYFSRKNIVDAYLNHLNRDDTKVCKISFSSALVNSVASGCTMVFNRKLHDLINSYSPEIIGMHDAWIYRVAAAFGKVIYDNHAYIDYRQHGSNVVGSDLTGKILWKQRLKRISQRPYDSTRSNYAKELLKGYQNQLNIEKKTLVFDLANCRNSMKCRCNLIFNSKLETQKYYEIYFLKFFILLGWI